MEDISVTVADDPIVVNIYTLAREWTVGNNITPTNLINFITYVMTSTQKFVTEKGNGQYKKRVVMTVLRKIGIATGKINIGKQAQQVANVWKACFPCCFKK